MAILPLNSPDNSIPQDMTVISLPNILKEGVEPLTGQYPPD